MKRLTFLDALKTDLPMRRQFGDWAPGGPHWFAVAFDGSVVNVTLCKPAVLTKSDMLADDWEVMDEAWHVAQREHEEAMKALSEKYRLERERDAAGVPA